MTLHSSPESTKKLTRPLCLLMVGLPNSGKSTLIRDYFKDTPCFSIDSFIEKYAQKMGKTYDDVYYEHIQDAALQFDQSFDDYINTVKRNCIVDKTNLSIEIRKNLLNKLEENNYTVFILHLEKDMTIIQQRNKNRVGKCIPDSAYEKMILSYQPPSLSENPIIKQIFYNPDHSTLGIIREHLKEKVALKTPTIKP